MPKNLLESNVLQPSKFLKDSTLRKNLPDDFVKAKNLWSQVVRDIENHLTALEAKGDDVEDFLEEINGLMDFDLCDAIFKKSCWSWAPSGRTVSFEETDRMGQHFLGAMYTCEGYEWPQHEGCPYKPFFQLSLDEASEIAEIYVGSGLLQLFEAPYLLFQEQGLGKPDWYLLRHIPRNKVSEDQMTPIPDFNEEQEQLIQGAFRDVFYEDDSECICVDGYTDKRFSMPYNIAENIGGFQSILSDCGIESLKTAVVHLGEINERLGRLTNKIGKKYFDTALFGFVDPIQTFGLKMPDPLLKIGGSRGIIDNWRKEIKLEIGLEGQGQVYLNFDSKEEPSYEFYWDL